MYFAQNKSFFATQALSMKCMCIKWDTFSIGMNIFEYPNRPQSHSHIDWKSAFRMSVNEIPFSLKVNWFVSEKWHALESYSIGWVYRFARTCYRQTITD